MNFLSGATQIETRPTSGSLANQAVFAGAQSWLNRYRKGLPKGISVMNHHLGKGGHLSAQVLGTLGPYVGYDESRGQRSVIHFPVPTDREKAYTIDIKKTAIKIQLRKFLITIIFSVIIVVIITTNLVNSYLPGINKLLLIAIILVLYLLISL